VCVCVWRFFLGVRTMNVTIRFKKKKVDWSERAPKMPKSCRRVLRLGAKTTRN
jgi:ribosomal protein L31E